MTLVSYDFESASPSGTALSTGNTSANQILTNGGTATSDNTVDMWSGLLCGKFVGPLNNQCLARFLASSSNLTMSFGGGFTIDSSPANAITLCTMRGSGLAASLRWNNTTNNITFNNAAGTSLATLVTGATPGNKYWASIRVTTTSTANTGTWTVNIYNSAGTLVGGTSGSSANLGTVAFTGGDFGVVDATHAAGVTVRWDLIQFNDGSSTEILPPTVITVADTAAAADAATVTATIPTADTGAATDTTAVTATVPTADTATATDALSVRVTVTVGDTGTGADNLGTTAQVAIADTGTASDAVSIGPVPVALVDTATGSDSIGVAAAVPLTDTGTGSDTFSATVLVPLSDTAAGVDTITVTTVIPLADTGHGTDTITVTMQIHAEAIDAHATLGPQPTVIATLGAQPAATGTLAPSTVRATLEAQP